jgi:hypothetical protein
MLANVIFMVHLLFILFMVIIPFTENSLLHILHITTTVTLLVHWVLNSDACFLSLLESKIRNIEYTESFISRIVSPVYKLNDNSVVYIITILLSLISVTKLSKSLYLKKNIFIYDK